MVRNDKNRNFCDLEEFYKSQSDLFILMYNMYMYIFSENGFFLQITYSDIFNK